MAGPNKRDKKPAPAGAPTETAGGVPATHLRVRSLVAGFRRAGRAWPAEETTVSVDDFSDEQVEQLLAESQLVVVPMSRAPEKQAEGTGESSLPQ